MVDTVKCLREVDGSNDRTKRRFPLVEARRDLGSKRKQRSRGRPSGGEAVLEWGAGEVREDERTDEALEEFGGRAEERNGAVGGA